MNSALKPVGVATSPVTQQLNKPVLQQSTPTTYGQPMSHLPQNLVNQHSTSTPANAHSNSIHTPNHFSVNSANISQQYVLGGSLPPPSNHPVANVNQTSPAKNINYSSNTNNVPHSYKITGADSTPDPVVEEASTVKPQSNGTPEDKPILEQEALQSYKEESSIKDKPPPPQLSIDVPETSVPSTEKAIEIPTSEKPIEVEGSAPIIKETVHSPDVVDTTPELVLSSKPVDLPDTTTSVTISVVSEPVLTSAPSIESSVKPPVMTNAITDSDTSLETEKVVEESTSISKPKAAVLPIIDQTSTANVNPVVNKPKEQSTLKPLKVATTQRIVRKNKLTTPETPEPVKTVKSEIKISNQKSTSLVAKNKRARTRTQPYQSPLPEVEMVSKMSVIASTSKPKKADEKLIVFYKNEFLAVRNPEGGFYLCQALHNIYKSTRKLRILWLSQDKTDSDIYTPDFYDQTDFDCILTNINLIRVSKGKFKLPDKERIRTDSILKRALAVEKGDATLPSPTEEHPDGLDLSLYKEESQLKKGKGKKRKASPSKTPKESEALVSPVQTKVRKLEPKPKPPPVTKALVIKKALAVKAKETSLNTNKLVKTKPAESEEVSEAKAQPTVDQKKAKVLAKVVKKPAVVSPPVQSVSSSTRPQPPRKQSIKSTDTVVPFLQKEPPTLKKEVPAKKEYLVLKKESTLKKEPLLKKEIPTKRNSVSKKDIPTVRKEMPVLKKEAPIVKKEVAVQKQLVLTRKSNRGKK